MHPVHIFPPYYPKIHCNNIFPSTPRSSEWFLSSGFPDKILYTFFISHIHKQSRDSSVGIALGCGLDDRGSGVRFPTGAGNFSLHHRVQNGSGAHPAVCPVGTGAISLGVKRPGREADHSPPSSAEVEE
jgi:hypothetical protein